MGQGKGIAKRSVPKDRQTCASFPSRMTLIKQDQELASLPDKPNGAVPWLPEKFLGEDLILHALGRHLARGICPVYHWC